MSMKVVSCPLPKGMKKEKEKKKRKKKRLQLRMWLKRICICYYQVYGMSYKNLYYDINVLTNYDSRFQPAKRFLPL